MKETSPEKKEDSKRDYYLDWKKKHDKKEKEITSHKSERRSKQNENHKG